MRLCVFGTADFGKPRTRILLNGLRMQNIVVSECLYDIWRGVEDKSQVKGFFQRMKLALNYLIAYPVLIWRYLRAPRHDAVFVAYMGHFDVLVLWPFAKLRRVKIVWDAFLSLYDTVVEDRALVKSGGLLASSVGALEGLACAAVDFIILDTKEHAAYFRQRYKIPPKKLVSVWVGAETGIFSPRAVKKESGADAPFNVLFYGQFIPLHGVEFIVDAARRTNDPLINWTIIGHGQESNRLKKLLDEKSIPSLAMIDWVPYRELPMRIAGADICLGVFGQSAKAARVIPNKVFQVLAMARPLITMDCPAIREIVTRQTPGVWLVEPGSGAAIADAVAEAKKQRDEGRAVGELYPGIREKISPAAIGKALTAHLQNVI